MSELNIVLEDLQSTDPTKSLQHVFTQLTQQDLQLLLDSMNHTKLLSSVHALEFTSGVDYTELRVFREASVGLLALDGIAHSRMNGFLQALSASMMLGEPNLMQSLSLYSVTVNADFYEALASPNNQNLTNINFVSVHSELRLEISPLLLRPFCTVTDLCLQKSITSIQDMESLATGLIGNTSVLNLDISGRIITLKRLQVFIEGFKCNRSIENLSLAGAMMGNSGMLELCEGLIERHKNFGIGLQCLNVRRNKIGEEGIQALLNGISNGMCIPILELGRNYVTDKSMSTIADLIRTGHSFLGLGLEQSGITNDGFVELMMSLTSNTYLIYIDIRSTPVFLDKDELTNGMLGLIERTRCPTYFYGMSEAFSLGSESYERLQRLCDQNLEYQITARKAEMLMCMRTCGLILNKNLLERNCLTAIFEMADWNLRNIFDHIGVARRWE